MNAKIKVLANWDEAKIKVAKFNSRALNALFSAVINEDLKKISSRIQSSKGSLLTLRR